jgi:hypothetical protein
MLCKIVEVVTTRSTLLSSHSILFHNGRVSLISMIQLQKEKGITLESYLNANGDDFFFCRRYHFLAMKTKERDESLFLHQNRDQLRSISFLTLCHIEKMGDDSSHHQIFKLFVSCLNTCFDPHNVNLLTPTSPIHHHIIFLSHLHLHLSSS